MNRCYFLIIAIYPEGRLGFVSAVLPSGCNRGVSGYTFLFALCSFCLSILMFLSSLISFTLLAHSPALFSRNFQLDDLPFRIHVFAIRRRKVSWWYGGLGPGSGA